MSNSIQVYEDNGGGLTLIIHDAEGRPIHAGYTTDPTASLCADMMHALRLGNLYDWAVWYDGEGNSMGDKDEEGRLITVEDAAHQKGRLIAEASDSYITIYLDRCGVAGRRWVEA